MRTPRSASLVVALALAAVAAAAVAQDAPKAGAAKPAEKEPSPEERAKRLDALLDDLAKRLGKIRTLRCRFVQEKYLAVFEDVVKSEGTLALAVPDRLRWEYEKPLKSVLTVNGGRAMREKTSRKGETTRRTYALDDEPVTSIAAQQVFLWMRGDFAKARESYDLALVTEEPPAVRATPKDERMRKVVESIDLVFAADRGRLAGVTLVEKGGAKTAITFADVEIDPALADSLFRIDD